MTTTINGTNGIDKVRDASAVSFLPFTKEYVSPQQTITAGAQLTLAHGLASKPKLVTGAFVCLTAEHGYSVGDEIIDPLGFAYTDAAALVTNTASIDSTSVYVRFQNVGGLIRILNKSTGALANLTPANWRYLVRAWA